MKQPPPCVFALGSLQNVYVKRFALFRNLLHSSFLPIVVTFVYHAGTFLWKNLNGLLTKK